MIANIGSVDSASLPARALSSTPNLPSLAPRTLSEDTIELSRSGRILARAVDTSSLRFAQVRTIRVAVENGVYETPERIDGTVKRLLDILG